jgi:hypothetical protein
MPFPLGPDVGNVAAPNLVRYWDVELSIQNIRNIQSFNRRSFIGMRAWLLADEIKLTHQTAHFEPAELLTILTHQREDATAAGGTATLRKQFTHPAAQSKSLNIRSPASETPGVVTRAGDFKHLAQPINRLVDAQLVN